MKKYIKKLFCKHNFVRFYVTLGSDIYHKSIWYYDDFQIDKCCKCGKTKDVNIYEKNT